jgi:hypothetical protein
LVIDTFGISNRVMMLVIVGFSLVLGSLEHVADIVNAYSAISRLIEEIDHLNELKGVQMNLAFLYE